MIQLSFKLKLEWKEKKISLIQPYLKLYQGSKLGGAGLPS